MSEQQAPTTPYNYGYAPPPAPPTPYGYAAGEPQRQALANQGRRLLARIIDIIAVMAAMVIVLGVFALLQRLWQNHGYLIGTAVLAIACSVAVLLYEPILTGKYGATLGKRALGLRVVRVDNGRPVSAGAAFGRWLSAIAMSFIPLLGPINVLSCCWDSDRQCLHDKAAGTVVVNAR